jgi:hypothetical protein
MDRYRQLERLHRAASAESDSAFREWETTRQELQTAAIGLERATMGLPPGSIRPDGNGRAVRTVERQVRTPVERMGLRVVDTSFVQAEERLPSFDDVTMRLHEAQQEHDRAREAMQAAGHKAGLYRRVVEEAAGALSRAGGRVIAPAPSSIAVPDAEGRP